MNILLVSTGGTIGSAISGGVIAPDAATGLHLLSMYTQAYGQDAAFTVKHLCDILSEDATDDFYELLLDFLRQALLCAYDGVVILHGTDTLPYTAALVACVFQHTKTPIGIVSANLPLSDPAGNGIVNLRAAIRYIQSGAQGVFVPYRNHDGRVWIHSGLRLLEADFSFDDFHSLYGAVAAEYKADEILVYPPSAHSEIQCVFPQESARVRFSKKLLLIQAYPGISYAAYNPLQGNIAAVLHTAYHSGTASNAAPPGNLPDFARRCIENGVPVYLAGLKSREVYYASTAAIQSSGVQLLADMTIPAAAAALKLTLNCPDFQIRDAHNRRIL